MKVDSTTTTYLTPMSILEIMFTLHVNYLQHSNYGDSIQAENVYLAIYLASRGATGLETA
jgi:hypothetical protein